MLVAVSEREFYVENSRRKRKGVFKVTKGGARDCWVSKVYDAELSAEARCPVHIWTRPRSVLYPAVCSMIDRTACSEEYIRQFGSVHLIVSINPKINRARCVGNRIEFTDRGWESGYNIAHELTHASVPDARPDHGESFVKAMLIIVKIMLGSRAEEVLESEYRKEKLWV